MRLLSTLICSVSFASLAQAQQGGLRGQVTDADQKPLAQATISLHQAQDSSVLRFVAADSRGMYAFGQLQPGDYLLSVTAVGHARVFSAPLRVVNVEVEVPLIRLAPQSKSLAGVTVVARKPMIEQKTDRMVINVDAAVSNVGATALEVLEKSPGVTVDRYGNISLKGRQGIQVYIDGRPAYLTGAELTNYLKGLPSSAIDQIEIMTQPSARFDAAGNAGVINIRSKKNRQKGFNGSTTLTLQQGRFTQTNGSLNLNYRTGKVNLFANSNYNHGNNFQNLDIHRRFRDLSTGTTTAIFDQEARLRNQNDNFSAKLGVDYFVNKRTTLGMVFSGFSNPERFRSRNTSFLKNAAGVTDSIAYAESDTRQKFRNGTANFNLRHVFDTTGRELTADIDIVRYRSINDQYFYNNSFDPSWNKQGGEELRSDLPVDIRIYSAKADYSQPFKGGKLEAGLKSSLVHTDNSAFYFNIISGNQVVVTGKTNQFDYREQINAAYINYERSFGKLGMQAGLRYEHTNIEGRQFGSPDKLRHPDSTFRRNYGNIFPTLFLSYKSSDKHQWSFSYGRRIDRPAYQDMNPFLFFLDKYTYQQGSPFMRPQFTDNLELGHTFRGFLTTTVNYGRTIDLMMETFEPARDGSGGLSYATIIKNGNVGLKETIGMSVSAQFPVTKWWNTVLYGNYNYGQFRGRLNGDGEQINVSASNLMFNANNQFRFGKGWGAELSGFWRSRGVEGQIWILGFGQVSAGISKQVLKNKATLKLSMRDVFWTNRQEGNINFQNTEARFVQVRQTQVGSLSFSWRFGKPLKDAAPRRRTGGAQDELNRIKGSN